jgi:ubiquitin carboxyl-terminal hydrolase 5/13
MGTVQELALNDNSGNNEGLFLRIVKKRIPKEDVSIMSEDTTSMAPTKLGVGVQGGFASEEEKFEIISTYSLVGLVRNNGTVTVVEERPYADDTKSSFSELLQKSMDSIQNHAGMAVQQDLSVWQLDEDPIPVSKYAADLPFVDNGIQINPDPSTWKCEASGDIENLWLNLSDGYIGGGRKHWDGSGGSNGALDHYLESGNFPLVVKLGTITADGGDCYSYAKDEDGPVQIPNLAALLEKRGINISGMYVQ